MENQFMDIDTWVGRMFEHAAKHDINMCWTGKLRTYEAYYHANYSYITVVYIFGMKNSK